MACITRAFYLKGLSVSSSLISMARPRKEITVRTYSQAIAARLRELRDEREWLVEDVADRIALCGSGYTCRSKKCGKTHEGLTTSQLVKCPYCGAATREGRLIVKERLIYCWEVGKQSGGSDIPIDFYPIIAAVYGFKYPHEWLPLWSPKFLSH